MPVVCVCACACVRVHAVHVRVRVRVCVRVRQMHARTVKMHVCQSTYQEEPVNADGGLDHVRYVFALCVLTIVLHLLARPLSMRRQVKVPWWVGMHVRERHRHTPGAAYC